MTPHQILIVAIRLFAIFLFVTVLRQIGGAVSAIESLAVDTTRLWIVIGLQCSVCLFLWVFPGTVAEKLLRGGKAEVSEAASLSSWRELLFIAVGIFVSSRAIPDTVYWSLLAIASGPDSPSFEFNQKIEYFVTLLELAIGAWLVFGAKGVGNVIQKFRES